MTLLKVDDVTHRYPRAGGGVPALHKVNFELDNNQVLAVVGESGCGKTTLGRVIARLIRPLSGTIRIDDDDLWSLRRKQLSSYRRSVQVVQQDPYGSLNPAITVADTLSPGLLRHGIVPRGEVGDETRQLLRLVGLDPTPDFLRRFPHQLSGGQRQRLVIARAISLRPKLIIADEAVSMLDVSMRVSILDLLLGLQTDHDLAYLFISHDFGVVRYFARGGRIMVMFYGVVVEEGATEDLIRRPRHPYTYLLLESIPVPDPQVARQRSTEVEGAEVEGAPAARGCIFANRCPFVEEKCRRERPPLQPDQTGRLVACHFPERVPKPETVAVAKEVAS